MILIITGVLIYHLMLFLLSGNITKIIPAFGMQW